VSSRLVKGVYGFSIQAPMHLAEFA